MNGITVCMFVRQSHERERKRSMVNSSNNVQARLSDRKMVKGRRKCCQEVLTNQWKLDGKPCYDHWNSTENPEIVVLNSQEKHELTGQKIIRLQTVQNTSKCS